MQSFHLLCPLALCLFSAKTGHEPAVAPQAQPVRAKYLITTTDDFIVDVYQNGQAVPIEKRELLREVFGATVEKINIEVRKGDWLVFHVVNNRMRWGGAYYFGAAGCFAPNEFGFVSKTTSGAWSACDSPKDADRFIERKTYLRHRAAQPIAQPWSEGDNLMREAAGSRWDGSPVWGSGRSVWLKVTVE